MTRGTTIDIRAALSDQELSTVLRKSGAPKRLQDRAEFRDAVNVALHNFAVARYMASLKPTPSSQLKHLKAITNTCRKLLTSLDPHSSAAAQAAWREIGRSSLQFRSKAESLFGDQVFENSGPRDHIKSAIELLFSLTTLSEARIQSVVRKSAATKKRHSVDKELKVLFGSLTSAWLFGFGAAPRLGSSANPGPFVLFVLEVFRIYASKLAATKSSPLKVVSIELQKFKATGIRSRYRYSGIAKLYADAKSGLKEF